MKDKTHLRSSFQGFLLVRRTVPLLLLLAAGCGSPGSSSVSSYSFPMHGDDAGPPPQCTRDPAELQALNTQIRPCTEDVNCPCGAYCAFGVCAYDCLADGDCSGTDTCTTRGRCDSQSGPPPTSGGLSVQPAALSFTARNTARRLSVSAQGDALANVVVTSDAGLILECDPTTSIGTAPGCTCTAGECTLSNLPAGAAGHLFARISPSGALPSPAMWTVRVAAQSEVRTLQAELLIPPLATLEGSYRGHATLLRSGTASEQHESALSELALPVEATIAAVGPSWPNAYRFEIREATRTLAAHSPDDSRVGDSEADLRSLAYGIIHCNSSPCRWEIRTAELASLPYTLSTPTSSPLERQGDRLGGALPLRVRGSTTWDSALVLDWQLSLQRRDQGCCAITCVADGSNPAIAAGTTRATCAPGNYQSCFAALAEQRCAQIDASYSASMHSFSPGGRCDPQNNTCQAITVPQRANAYMPLDPLPIVGETEILAFFGPASRLNEDERLQRTADWAHSGVQNSLFRCEWDLRRQPADSVACGPNTKRDCWDLASRFGCTIRCPRCIPGYHCPAWACTRCDFPASQDPHVADADKALLCAQRYLCYQPNAQNGPPDGKGDGKGDDGKGDDGDKGSKAGVATAPEPGSMHFGTQTMVQSRDLLCTADEEVYVAPSAVAFFSNMQRGQQVGQQPYAPTDLLNRCLSDLQRAPAPGESLDQLFQSEGCVNAPRLFRAMYWASRPADLRKSHDTADTEQSLAADALYHRLVQQWIGIHAFVAREGGQQARLSALVAASASSTVPTRGQLLDRLESGWRRILQPRLAHSLLRLAPSVLFDPDYRLRPFHPWLTQEEKAIAAQAADPQAVGLPASLLAGVTAYLEVLEREIEVAALGGTIAARQLALTRMALGLRYAQLAEALANVLFQRASTVGTPAWQTQWEVNRDAFRRMLTRVLNRARSLGAAENLLGIGPEDLPLYFVDPQTPNTQFFAASDYLMDKAQGAVARADATLGDARAAWSSWHSQTMQDRLTRLNQTQRINEVKTFYGQQLQSLCGVKAGYVAEDLLEQWIDGNGDGKADIPPGLCFLDTADQSCVVNENDLLQVADASAPEDIKLQLCLGVRAYPGSLGAKLWEDPAVNAVIAWLASNGQQAALTRLHNANVSRDALGRVVVSGGGGIHTLSRQALFGAARDLNLSLEDIALCQQEFPAGGIPTIEELPDNPLRRPECFQGQLGDAALATRAASENLQALQSQLNDLVESYDVAIRSCFILEAQNAALLAAEEAHDAAMTRLLDMRFDAQNSASRWGVIGGFVSILGGVASNNPFAIGSGIAAIGGGNASNDVAAAQFAIDLLDELHDTEMMRISQMAQNMSCYNEAEAHLIGFRTAYLESAQAQTDLVRALARFQEMKREVTTLVAAGRRAVDRERNTDLPRFAHDHWLDERIDRFENEFRWAKRTVFLLAKAVEYEKQTPLTDRAPGMAILRAQTPVELSQSLIGLEAILGDRSLAGQTPNTAPLHVPLCRYLAAPVGVDPRSSQVSCDVENFQRMLADPAHAVYDGDGMYQGQALPFSLMPFGAHIGSEAGERVWSVSARIDGNANGFGFGNYTWLWLLKKNTFFSQWADGAAAHVSDMQIGTSRPCHNLFLEAGAYMPSTPPPTCDASGHTRAALQTPFGQFGNAFWNDNNYSPASTELRGRGLYGDYALFIPAAEISAGLLLDRIWDIYLRFSYNRVTVP